MAGDGISGSQRRFRRVQDYQRQDGAQFCLFYSRICVFPFTGNNLRWNVSQSDNYTGLRPTYQTMLPAVIVLLLLTALVATDSAPSGGDDC